MTDAKVVLLKQGICLLGQLEEETKGTGLVWIIQPVEIEKIPVVNGNQVGETFSFKPWMALSSDEKFILSKRDILTFCNPDAKILNHYKNFVAEYYESNREVAVSREEQEEQLESLYSETVH
jgi:hypothetical protein